MDRADFIHLVRLSEHASAENSAAYRRSVALFAALGYAWVVGCALLAAGLIWWVGSSLAHGRIRAAWLWLLLFALGLLWSSLRALWLRLEPPVGQVITAADAPQLFESLEKIRAKIKGPPIHHVVLNDEFNASISQHPRYGLFGGAVNYLTLGLPLLLALDRRRFLAVLAHEYGHLRGDHGLLGAWIYRTRITWLKLYHALRGDAGVVAAATQGFLQWYFPRFAARTFALARQDEYEADQVSARLLGAPVMAAALIEVQIKGAWLEQAFWTAHWRQAAEQPMPVGPFASMAQVLPVPPEDAFAQSALREALRRVSDVDDTHPVLRDRLESLEQSSQLPEWSTKPALSLLGTKVPQWLAQFDKQWCRDNASEWKQHHAYLARMRERVQALLGSLGRNNANEMVELAELQERLDPSASVQAHYERALTITPEHGGALRGLARCLPETDHARRMTCLQTLFDASPANRWWACKRAVQELEPRVRQHAEDEQRLTLWRERLKQADEAERRAWEEHTTTPFFSGITRDDLSEYEKGELRADLARFKPIVRAWIVRKNLREFPQRRAYTVFVELPDMDDESRYELCRHLERSLNLPGTALVLWAGHSPTLQDIERQTFGTVYARGSR